MHLDLASRPPRQPRLFYPLLLIATAAACRPTPVQPAPEQGLFQGAVSDLGFAVTLSVVDGAWTGSGTGSRGGLRAPVTVSGTSKGTNITLTIAGLGAPYSWNGYLRVEGSRKFLDGSVSGNGFALEPMDLYAGIAGICIPGKPEVAGGGSLDTIRVPLAGSVDAVSYSEFSQHQSWVFIDPPNVWPTLLQVRNTAIATTSDPEWFWYTAAKVVGKTRGVTFLRMNCGEWSDSVPLRVF